jgi:hypothetical protein
MATQRMSYQQWREKLGQVVPLALVPELLRVDAAEVRAAIRRCDLAVHTFRADDGRVFRLVRLRDLQHVGRNRLLTMQGMVRALRTMTDDRGDTPRQAA